MKRLILVLIFLFPQVCLAFEGIYFDFKTDKIKQGSFQSVLLKMDESTAEKIDLQKLKGENIGETVYIQDVGPLAKMVDAHYFESTATIIFLKVPATDGLLYKTSKFEIPVKWSKILVIPTEAGKELLFGSFTLPQKVRIIFWLFGTIFLVIIFLIIFNFRKKWQAKKAIKFKRNNLKDEILSAARYEQVVNLWKNKHSFISQFPHLDEPFKVLEQVLFKYQFKPHQSEQEKAEVVKAYKEFKNKIDGGFNGI